MGENGLYDPNIWVGVLVQVAIYYIYMYVLFTFSTASKQSHDHLKNIVKHWILQGVRSKTFAKFDYGSAEKNRAHYGQDRPPLYNISRIQAAVGIFSGENDWLADSKVSTLYFVSDRFCPRLGLELISQSGEIDMSDLSWPHCVNSHNIMYIFKQSQSNAELKCH